MPASPHDEWPSGWRLLPSLPSNVSYYSHIWHRIDKACSCPSPPTACLMQGESSRLPASDSTPLLGSDPDFHLQTACLCPKCMKAFQKVCGKMELDSNVRLPQTFGKPLLDTQFSNLRMLPRLTDGGRWGVNSQLSFAPGRKWHAIYSLSKWSVEYILCQPMKHSSLNWLWS